VNGAADGACAHSDCSQTFQILGSPTNAPEPGSVTLVGSGLLLAGSGVEVGIRDWYY
jgi:hypothetical protein